MNKGSDDNKARCLNQIAESAKRRIIMENIGWITSFEEGLYRAKAENKLVFLDFFNPN